MNLSVFSYEQLVKYRDQQNKLAKDLEAEAYLLAELDEEKEFERLARRANDAYRRAALAHSEVLRRDKKIAAKELRQKRRDSLKAFGIRRGLGSY